ncbi:hypothetical protein DFQ13_102355 [Actinokineospora spheciospongiae]|nr:hypothetical protein DFQ13_102355 [Actinokineospora spheciospongiae]
MLPRRRRTPRLSHHPAAARFPGHGKGPTAEAVGPLPDRCQVARRASLSLTFAPLRMTALR